MVPFVENAVVFIIGGKAGLLGGAFSLFLCRICVDTDGIQLQSWKSKKKKSAGIKDGILDRSISCGNQNGSAFFKTETFSSLRAWDFL